MTKLTLFDLKTSKDFVEELDLEESKLVWGGYPDEGDTSGGSQSGGSSDDEEPPVDPCDVYKCWYA